MSRKASMAPSPSQCGLLTTDYLSAMADEHHESHLSDLAVALHARRSPNAVLSAFAEAVPEAVQALHETFQLSLAEVQRERPFGEEAR